MRSSQKIKAEIEQEFGFFPSFFEPAEDNPQVLEHLWQQTRFAYINNPFPSIFKEKLFAYLSRYCNVAYCLVCHSSFLRHLKGKGAEILHLLRSLPPSLAEIHFHLNLLQVYDDRLTDLQKLSSVIEESLLRCSIFIALEKEQAEFCRNTLRCLLGNENYEHLVTLIAYIKTCHLWTEAHPEISYESDLRSQAHLSELFQEEPTLEKFFQTYSEKVNQEGLEKVFHTQNFNWERFTDIFPKAVAKNIPFIKSITSGTKGVLLLDPQQASQPILYSNLAFTKISGYQPDEIVGRNWGFLQGRNTNSEKVEFIRRAISQVRGGKVRVLNYRKDGQPFWNELKIYPVLSEGGDLLYCIGIVTDISDRLPLPEHSIKLQQQSELQKNKEKLKQQRLAWLDGIRIFAAVAILLYHAQLLFINYAYTPQPTGLIDNLEQLAYLTRKNSFIEQLAQLFTIPALFAFQFVDVFILLSGFSLTVSLKSKHLQVLKFLNKRLLRLLFPFWTVAWLSYPVLWAIGVATNSYIPDAWHTFVGATFPLVFSVRGEFLYETSGPWWFVPLIISFTVIFPFLWQLLQQWGSRNLLIFSTLLTIAYRALAVYVLGGHPTYIILNTPANEQPFQIFLSKLSIFVVGMAIARAYKKGHSPIYWSSQKALLVGIPLYLLGFICQFYRVGWVFADLLLPLGLTLIFMVFFRRLSRSPQIHAGMIALGKHSYTFFLIHNFVIDRTINLVVRGNPLLYYLLLPVMVLGTLFLAIVADSLEPLIKKMVTAILRDINYIMTRGEILNAREQNWIPQEGDRVFFQNEPGWRILKVERLVDINEFSICRISKSERALWVNENKLSLDKSHSESIETKTVSPVTRQNNLFLKKFPFDIDKIIIASVIIIGVPTIFFYYMRVDEWNMLGLHIAIATIYLFTSLGIIYESSRVSLHSVVNDKNSRTPRRLKHFLRPLLASLGIKKISHPQPNRPLPYCSCIVVAYLPNEQDIILDTITHILTKVQRPESGLELILAYNTPENLPVEKKLRDLAKLHPELHLLRVEESKSKAENLNAAIKTVTGAITCILDADHHPNPDSFIRAWQWLEHDYDVVQGRNVIRNHGDNLLTQIVAIEFESIYGVSHPAKTLLVDTAIFGGSNGYWNTSVLKRIRFNPTMLTEDIDASLRTLVQGYRIVHDPSIISTEFAPTQFKSFWSQRKRWAQGWLEVTLKYQRYIWQSDYFNAWQKAYWTYLLYYRELFSLIALQIYPIILSFMLFQGFFPLWSYWYLWVTMLITLFSGLYQTLVTMQMAHLNYPIRYFVQYAIITFFYTTLKHFISIVALYDHLKGQTEWVVTPRHINQKAVNAS